MKFEVIIGNPPYNNGVDLDFMDLANRLNPDFISMIIPGKWHIKQDIKNINFRETFVDRMQCIVFYPDCGDIFGIRLTGGITYFLITKNKQEYCNVKTICERAKALESKGYEIRQLDKEKCFLYNEICYSIVEKVGALEKKFIPWVFKNMPMDDNYNVFGSAIMANSGGKTSYNIFSKAGTIPVLPPLTIVRWSAYRTHDIQCYFSAKTEGEANAFISWVNSKLIRFLLLMRNCTYHNNNVESWSFVPKKEDFNNIIKDEYLYNLYNLTQEEIEVIESIIK